MNDAQTAGIIALHSYSYMAPAWRRHQTAPPADADAVPAAASALASAVLLPMQAWVTAGVHGLGLLEQSAIETLKEALFAEGCSWGGSTGAGRWAAIIMEVVVLEGRGYRWRWRRPCGG